MARAIRAEVGVSPSSGFSSAGRRRDGDVDRHRARARDLRRAEHAQRAPESMAAGREPSDRAQVEPYAARPDRMLRERAPEAAGELDPAAATPPLDRTQLVCAGVLDRHPERVERGVVPARSVTWLV